MYVRKIVIIIIIIKARTFGYPVNPQTSSGFWDLCPFRETKIWN